MHSWLETLASALPGELRCLNDTRCCPQSLNGVDANKVPGLDNAIILPLVVQPIVCWSCLVFKAAAQRKQSGVNENSTDLWKARTSSMRNRGCWWISTCRLCTCTMDAAALQQAGWGRSRTSFSSPTPAQLSSNHEVGGIEKRHSQAMAGGRTGRFSAFATFPKAFASPGSWPPKKATLDLAHAPHRISIPCPSPENLEGPMVARCATV